MIVHALFHRLKDSRTKRSTTVPRVPEFFEEFTAGYYALLTAFERRIYPTLKSLLAPFPAHCEAA